MLWILDSLFGRRSQEENIEDVEYEDLTPPVDRKETYEDFTGENPGKP